MLCCFELPSGQRCIKSITTSSLLDSSPDESSPFDVSSLDVSSSPPQATSANTVNKSATNNKNFFFNIIFYPLRNLVYLTVTNLSRHRSIRKGVGYSEKSTIFRKRLHTLSIRPWCRLFKLAKYLIKVFRCLIAHRF